MFWGVVMSISGAEAVRDGEGASASTRGAYAPKILERLDLARRLPAFAEATA